MSKRIVIVGGGYLGAQLAKSLDGKASVTLIEQNSHFVHASAMIRALVEPKILDRALISYDGLLKEGKVIRGRVERIERDGVFLVGGEKIPADIIVVATGSRNAAPFKSNESGINALRAHNRRISDQIQKASTIAIVGAGAVGTELAGEISHFMPDKKVSLICDQLSLFPDFPDNFGRNLTEKLRASGVELIFGVRARNLESTSEPYQGKLELTNGSEIAADVIFPAIGSVARSELLESLPGVEKSASNRVKVDSWMRPSRLPNVFAAGDVVDAGDGMTIIAASGQVPWLSKTLQAVDHGTPLESLSPYKANSGGLLFVPLGPAKGNSQMRKFTVGDFLTRLIKGKHLFIPRYQKLFGQG